MSRLYATIAAVIVVLATAGTVYAQTSVRSDIEVTRSDIQADRKAIVADNLPLTDAQAAAFWPVYNAYRMDLTKLGDRLVTLITDYAKNYDTLDDTKAAAYTTEFLGIQKDIVAVKAKYQSKFTAVVPAKLVMRFYQIENKLDTIIMLDAVASVPLAK